MARKKTSTAPTTKARVRTRAYDSAEYLDSPEAIAAYLTEALLTADAAFVAKAIGTAARAKGMSSIAARAGLSRENLYRSLSGETRTEFETVMRVLEALGVELTAKAKKAA